MRGAGWFDSIPLPPNWLRVSRKRPERWGPGVQKNPLYLLASLLLVTAACGDGSNPADPPELLFVQNSDGGTLTDSTLTLTGVSPQTGWFTDRPYRVAGQVPTEEFVSLWDEGSVVDDPPNADFTCTVDGEVVNYVVELTSARLDGDELT